MVHILADAHKLAKNTWALVRLLLSNDELHTRGVHAVPKRGYNGKISNTEKSIKLILFQRLVTGSLSSGTQSGPIPNIFGHVLMMDRNEVKTPIFTINVRNKLGDLSFELGRISECRWSHLDHHDVAYPFWIILKELLESAQLEFGSEPDHQNVPDLRRTFRFYLLNNALHNIKLITSYNDLLPFVQRAQSFEFRQDPWSLTRSNYIKSARSPRDIIFSTAPRAKEQKLTKED